MSDLCQIIENTKKRANQQIANLLFLLGSCGRDAEI